MKKTTVSFDNAQAYFFGDNTKTEVEGFAAKDVAAVFRSQWLEWRRWETQPLTVLEFIPSTWELYLDSLIKLGGEENTVRVYFRNSDALPLWEYFLEDHCPWLSYETLTGLTSFATFNIYQQLQEVRPV